MAIFHKSSPTNVERSDYGSYRPDALVRALGHFASELLGSSAASTLALPARGDTPPRARICPGCPGG